MSFHHIVQEHEQIRFANNVRMVAQQRMNPVRGAVTEMAASGAAIRVADLLAQVSYLKKEDRSRRNPENPMGRSNRWLVRPEGMDSGEYIDKEDRFELAMDPSSQLVRGHTLALTRGFADRIFGVEPNGAGGFQIAYGGIMGRAVSGPTRSTITDLSTDNYIPHNSEGFTTEKARAAQEAMEIADFGLEDDDQTYCAITPKQKTDLINLALEAKESQVQFQIEAIRSGKPTTLLGINWIFTNRLPKTGTTRYCPMWTKANVVAGLWQDIQGAIWNDTSAKNLPYVYVDGYIDATRIEDAGVRIIECTEGT